MEVLDLVARLVGLAVLLDTVELLSVRPLWGPRGVWRWATLAGDYAGAPRLLRSLMGRLLGDRGFVLVLAARALAALALMALGLTPAVVVALATSLLVSARWRGTVNGGSDAMQVVVLLGLTAPALLPGSAIAGPAGLGYIAAQVTLSYVIAGLTKLKERAWRRGEALPALLSLPRYGAPRALVAALRGPGRARLVTAGMLAFECGFPLVFLGGGVTVGVLGAGLLFHAVNARALGLHRFLLAWGAAYPAVWWWGQHGPLG